MPASQALGIRLYKPSPKDWPAAEWAVVVGGPDRIVAHGAVRPPRAYDEAEALRHLHEALVTAVREHDVTIAFIWAIEGNARVNVAMRPRLRAEGVACAAAALAGARTSLVAWPEIESRADAHRPKIEYATATEVGGIQIGSADPQAVLVAVAALRS